MKKLINFKVNLPLFIFILSIIILNTYLVINMYKQSILKKDTIRLHVVSNSNETNDLVEKLKISDKLNTYISSLDLGNDKNDAIKTIKTNIDKILNIANNSLKEDNLNYSAYAKVGSITYDEKLNEFVTMPKGTYDSLQVVLGEGKGTNFWSLIFPSRDNINNLESLETILPGITKIYGDNSKSHDLISDNKDDNQDNNEKTYTLKILEIFDKIKNKLSN